MTPSLPELADRSVRKFDLLSRPVGAVLQAQVGRVAGVFDEICGSVAVGGVELGGMQRVVEGVLAAVGRDVFPELAGIGDVAWLQQAAEVERPADSAVGEPVGIGPVIGHRGLVVPGPRGMIEGEAIGQMFRYRVGDPQGNRDRERAGLQVDGVDLTDLIELVGGDATADARCFVSGSGNGQEQSEGKDCGGLDFHDTPRCAGSSWGRLGSKVRWVACPSNRHFPKLEPIGWSALSAPVFLRPGANVARRVKAPSTRGSAP